MRKVLLINDSRFESIILKDLLSTMGYEVKIADEYNAMKSVKTYEPDFVIANLIMKEIRGDQLISLIKVQYPDIVCILSSSDPIKYEQFSHKKVDAIFQTPVDKVKLEQVFYKMNETLDVMHNKYNHI